MGPGLVSKKARQPKLPRQIEIVSGQNFTRTPNWICLGV